MRSVRSFQRARFAETIDNAPVKYEVRISSISVLTAKACGTIPPAILSLFYSSGTGNRSTRRILNQRRFNDPRLEHTRIHHCHAVFRRGRRLFSHHAAHNGMARETKVTRASTTLGNFFAPLSFARTFCHTGNHPRARKAVSGIFVGNRSFLLGRSHLYRSGGFEADVGRTVISTKSREAPVDPSFRLGLSVLARHDGRGRIDGNLEGVTTAGGQCRPHGSHPLAST